MLGRGAGDKSRQQTPGPLDYRPEKPGSTRASSIHTKLKHADSGALKNPGTFFVHRTCNEASLGSGLYLSFSNTFCCRARSLQRYAHGNVEAKSTCFFAPGTDELHTNVSKDSWAWCIPDPGSPKQDFILADTQKRHGQIATDARAWSLQPCWKSWKRDKFGRWEQV